MKNKIRNFLHLCAWCFTSAPNNVFTGTASVLRLVWWTLVLKRFKNMFIGKYFNLNFLYNTHSDGCATVYTNPYPEYPLHKFIEFWMKHDRIFFDIGSNVGYYTILAASLGAKVYSFEPNANVLRIQRMNILLNALEDKVKIFNNAVSDKAGNIQIYLGDLSHSLVSSVVRDPVNSGKTVPVPAVTLDQMVKENKVKTIHLLKIDVEGAEEFVMNGGKDTLSSGMVQAISWETWSTDDPKLRAAQRRCLKLLTQYGYLHYGLDAKGKQIIMNKWKSGNANCLSVHKTVARKINAFKKVH